MCLLIAAKSGVPIHKKYLKNGFVENSHGCGFVVAKDGKLIMRKGFFSFKDFWRVYRDYQSYDKIVHFRWASVGKQTIENCHPFFVSDKLAMAHNGTIPIATKDDRSDTFTFNQQVLRLLNQENINFLENSALTYLISKSIGQSKLAFLDNEGRISIINKHLGVEHEDVWYSNNDYKAFPNTTFAGRHVKPQTTVYTGGNNGAYDKYYQSMMGEGWPMD